MIHVRMVGRGSEQGEMSVAPREGEVVAASSNSAASCVHEVAYVLEDGECAAQVLLR